MPHILLSKSGQFIVREWCPEKRLYEDFVQETGREILVHWHDPISLEPGTTLASLMTALAGIRDRDFLDALVQAPMDQMISQALEPLHADSRQTELTHVELYWSPEIDRRWQTPSGKTGFFAQSNEESEKGGDFSGPESVSFFPNCHGLGPSPGGEYNLPAGEEMAWGIGLSPINHLAHCELKLNEKCDIYYDIFFNKRQPTREDFLETKYACKTLKPWQLGEMIFGIFWELSFYGGPEEKSEVLEEIEETMRRIESGEEALCSMEDLLGLSTLPEPEPTGTEDDTWSVRFISPDEN